jgi:hypothetical protein
LEFTGPSGIFHPLRPSIRASPFVDVKYVLLVYGDAGERREPDEVMFSEYANWG